MFLTESIVNLSILYRLGVVTLLTVACTLAHASIVITNTRVIYPASEREVTVKLNNNGTQPALVQTWVDDGDIEMGAQDRPMPFTLMPPIFRVDPAKGQTLRMMYTQEPLPQDRESVYYLNVLEIPPKPTAELAKGQNLLQMAFRTRIKIFFRPKGLPGSANEAPGKLVWKVVPSDKGYVAQAENPTPWYVSIPMVKLTVNGKVYQTSSGMVPPMGHFDFLIPELAAQPTQPGIVFTVVNDYGGFVELLPGGKPSQGE